MKIPLYRHKNGQWCKRIGGKIYYFGTELSKALVLYEKSRESIAAGCGKHTDSPEYALHELADLYYSHKKQQVVGGEFSERSLLDSKKTLDTLCAIMDRESVPASWTQNHYTRLKGELFKSRAGNGKRSHTTVAGDIRRIRAFLGWCKRAKLAALDYESFLREPPARAIRLERSNSSSGPLEAEAIRAILSKCGVRFKPLVLLGINGGLGAGDIANLTLESLEGEWLVCPRLKTGAPRRIWLWPETREAIAAYRKKASQAVGVAFVTRGGKKWTTHTSDLAGQMFTKAREEAGLERGSFYDLRRTFQTVGDETLDFPAVSFCMGHTPSSSDMAARYRQINDERIRAVCEHVRSWLFKTPAQQL
jgi:integrase